MLFVVVIVAIIVAITVVVVKQLSVANQDQGGSYWRFLPDRQESGRSIVVIFSFLRPNRLALAVEECSWAKGPLLERGPV